jgi:NAD(P)-dependent dehydrogenase (short-subunit alcohol dehydrogenase family)
MNSEKPSTTQLAIITGASAGIGAAAAANFLSLNYTVYALARRTCPIPGVLSLACDLSDSESIELALNQILSNIDGPTEIALIHNASQMQKDSTEACEDTALREVLETNVVAINHLNRRLIPHMSSGSSILYVGSTLSEKAVAGSFSYVVSKHAQLGIMRATCQDLMGRGIHTALICPGFTDTEMLRTHIKDDVAVLESIGSMNAFNRLVRPEEIAQGLVFCHANPAINGSVFHLNLGQKES